MAARKLPLANNPLAFYRAGGPGPETVVLGHALGADHRMWDRVLRLLPDRVRVVLWDQPGHGNSALLSLDEGTQAGSAAAPEAGVGGSSALGELALSVNSIAAALHEGLVELGVVGQGTPPVVAGLSLGGMVSLAYAEDYPDGLSELLMFSSGAVLLPSDTWTERAQLVTEEGLTPLADATMGRWFSESFAGGPDRDALEQTRQTFLGTSPEGYAQCCLAIAETDLRPGLANVRVPVRLIVGEDDPGMTPAQAVVLAEALPDATVTVIEGARHLTAVEEPEQVAGAITAALG